MDRYCRFPVRQSKSLNHLLARLRQSKRLNNHCRRGLKWWYYLAHQSR
ncbi:Uncharacterised protein [Vibrio cholerae]|nr:Uncharacterised protein [Vibrio cholerae]